MVKVCALCIIINDININVIEESKNTDKLILVDLQQLTI